MAKKKPAKYAGSVVGSEIAEQVCDRPTSAEPGKYAKHLSKGILEGGTLSQALERQRGFFAAILESYVVLAGDDVSPDQDGVVLLDMGDGWKRYGLRTSQFNKASALETLLEAVRGMDLIYLIQHYTGKAKLNAATVNAMECVFKLGYLKMFLEGVRANENLLNEGWERVEARKNGLPKAHAARRKMSVGPRAQSNAWMAELMQAGSTQRGASLEVVRRFKAEQNREIGQSTVITYWKSAQQSDNRRTITK